MVKISKGRAVLQKVYTAGVSHGLAGLRLSFLLTWDQKQTPRFEKHNTNDTIPFQTPRWRLHKQR